MDMFVALADPTRRHILELLASSGELPATTIYEQFPVSPQAVSQHLKVLREAHLVVKVKLPQKRLYRLNPQTPSQSRHPRKRIRVSRPVSLSPCRLYNYTYN